MRRLLSLLAVSILLLAGHKASANQETLSFRANSVGQMEAVISGVASCGDFRVLLVDTIEIGPSTIAINSFALDPSSGGCGGGFPPPPRVPYEVVATLGNLPRQVFTVNWTYIFNAQPQLKRPLASATLDVKALDGPAPIPAISGAGVAALSLLLAGTGWLGLRRQSST